MPLHVAATTRREFLLQTTAGALSLSLLRTGWGADVKANPHRFALLSDTHIPEKPEIVARETNMTSNLRQVIREVIALEEKPTAVMVNGDCAYLKGLKNDYVNFADCVAPLEAASLPLHLTLGNHDDREVLYSVMVKERPAEALVESKHVSVVSAFRANWFLLDSLMETNVVTGQLGTEQLNWLAKMLDAHADKPAIVVAHHTPQFEPPPEGKRWGGLEDTAAFIDLLQAKPHVKAFVYGHSHNWATTKHGHLHLINLPPVAYVFGAGKPNGWVQADLLEDGIRLELKTIDKAHPKNGEVVSLLWS